MTRVVRVKQTDGQKGATDDAGAKASNDATLGQCILVRINALSAQYLNKTNKHSLHHLQHSLQLSEGI